MIWGVAVIAAVVAAADAGLSGVLVALLLGGFGALVSTFDKVRRAGSRKDIWDNIARERAYEDAAGSEDA